MEFRIKHSVEGSGSNLKCSAGLNRAGLKRIIALCIGSLIPVIHGAENEVTVEVEMTQPDLEFLEFLGQFETDDGQWIDPGSLLSEEFEDLLNVAENSAPPDNSDNSDNSDNN